MQLVAIGDGEHLKGLGATVRLPLLALCYEASRNPLTSGRGGMSTGQFTISLQKRTDRSIALLLPPPRQKLVGKACFTVQSQTRSNLVALSY